MQTSKGRLISSTSTYSAYVPDPASPLRLDDFVRRPVHPQVQQVLEAAETAVQASVTVMDSLRSLSSTNSVTMRNQMALSVADGRGFRTAHPQ